MRLIDADELANQFCKDCGLLQELNGNRTCAESCSVVSLINDMSTFSVDDAVEQAYRQGLMDGSKGKEGESNG